YLRRKRIVNSRKRIHFEMENAAIHRAPSKRISHYIVRSTMAPKAVESPHESDEATQTITTLLRQFKTAVPIHPGMNLELDLGFDSLERVQLIETIERLFELEVNDDEASQIYNV